MGTTYKGLYLPATSETGWTASINGNFSTIADAVTSLFLPAENGLSSAGAGPTSVGTFPNQVRIFSLTNAATVGACWTFRLPTGWASDTLTVTPVWYPSVADGTAHAVRWQIDLKSIGAGFDVGGPGTTLTWTGGSTARAANITVVEEVTPITTGFSVGEGAVVRFAISRLGADASDTLVANVQLLGVQVDSTGS